MEKKNKHCCNPWFSLWSCPRTTMRAILDEEHYRGMWVVVVIAGLIMGLFGAFSATPPTTSVPFATMFITLIGYALAGAVLNVIAVFVLGLLLKWIGFWFGGKGTYMEVRAAVAWANLPVICLGILKAFELLIFGTVFPWVMLLPSSNPATAPLAYVFAGINLLISIWIVVILIKNVAEAHRFSSWLSLFALIIALVIFVVVLAIFAALIGMMTHGASMINING